MDKDKEQKWSLSNLFVDVPGTSLLRKVIESIWMRIDPTMQWHAAAGWLKKQCPSQTSVAPVHISRSESKLIFSRKTAEPWIDSGVCESREATNPVLHAPKSIRVLPWHTQKFCPFWSLNIITKILQKLGLLKFVKNLFSCVAIFYMKKRGKVLHKNCAAK